MSEIKLFELGHNVRERVFSEAVLEKELQNIIEQHMELFFWRPFSAKRICDNQR